MSSPTKAKLIEVSSFIEALERIFAKNGVPWSDKPLLPIMPAGAGDVRR